MNKFLLLTIILLLTFGGFAQSVHFQNISLEDAEILAAEENKGIFIDIYTTWCGPCRWMDINVFNQPEVADYMNTKFVSIKVDAEGADRYIARKFNVRAYPTYIFLDTAGKVKRKEKGTRRVNEFLSIAMSSSVKSDELQNLHDQYKNGDRSPEFMWKYLEVLRLEMNPRYKTVLKKYFNKQEDWMTESNMNLILLHGMERVTDVGFLFVIENRDTFDALHSQELIDELLRATLREELKSNASIEPSNKMAKLYLSAFGDKGQRYFEEDHLYQMVDKLIITDPGALAKAARKCFEKNECEDWHLLNEVTLRLTYMTENRETLLMLLDWIEQSIVLEKNSKNMDTYSVILYKLGEDEKAISMVVEGNSLAVEEGVKFNHTLRTLRKSEKN